ncbi:MAG TPA: hypothetical protein VGP12_00480, partial [Nitrosospira sp.]|nr:hypothetical protein [Nitrosospira sp.]
ASSPDGKNRPYNTGLFVMDQFDANAPGSVGNIYGRALIATVGKLSSYVGMPDLKIFGSGGSSECIYDLLGWGGGRKSSSFLPFADRWVNGIGKLDP